MADTGPSSILVEITSLQLRNEDMEIHLVDARHSKVTCSAGTSNMVRGSVMAGSDQAGVSESRPPRISGTTTGQQGTVTPPRLDPSLTPGPRHASSDWGEARLAQCHVAYVDHAAWGVIPRMLIVGGPAWRVFRSSGLLTR